MKVITASDLKKRLDKNEVFLIDVREPEEYRNEHIEDSHLIPLSKINIELLPLTKKPLVIYCASGKRSSDACAKLLVENPFLDICSLSGGIIAWKHASYSVKKSEST